MSDDDKELPPEGDLDPDLRDDAGYPEWEQTPRRVRPFLVYVGAVLLVLALVVPLVLRALSG